MPWSWEMAVVHAFRATCLYTLPVGTEAKEFQKPAARSSHLSGKLFRPNFPRGSGLGYTILIPNLSSASANVCDSCCWRTALQASLNRNREALLTFDAVSIPQHKKELYAGELFNAQCHVATLAFSISILGCAGYGVSRKCCLV